MADRTESLILDFQVDLEDSVESINSLTKQSKALREERNKLNIQSEAGKKRATEINALLDQNTNKIKSNSSAIERQRQNIGNYRSALDGVHPALGKVGQGLEAGASGFKAMAKSALAFIATPIGAVLAALVAVFTLLKSALSQNDALMDKFENITSAVGVVLEVVVARVGKLGEALIALAQGNFSEAINKTSEAFGGLAEEIGNAVTQQQLFLDASRDLEDSQRALRIETARQENEIKRLVVAAKNRNATFDEQEGFLREALALEQQLVEKREDIARRDLLITARQLRKSKEFQQQSNETFDQYIERLLSSSALGDEELNKIVEKVEALEQARGSSLAFQEKVENSLSAVQEKRAVALEKINKALEEQAALDEAIRRANSGDPTRPTENPLTAAFETQADVITDISKRMNDDLVKRNKEKNDQIIRDNRKSAEIQNDIERAKLDFAGHILGTISTLFRQESEEGKILASASALINTYLAATAALASGSEINPIFGILSAAAAIANGLAAVARINGVQFAEGGWTGPGSKMQAVGIVHADEYVVPKRIRNSPMAQPHLNALETMRVRGYADGGLVANSVTQPINQQLEIMNIIKNMPPVVASWSEGRKVGRRLEFKERVSKR